MPEKDSPKHHLQKCSGGSSAKGMKMMMMHKHVHAGGKKTNSDAYYPTVQRTLVLCVILSGLQSLGGAFSKDVIAAVSPQIRKSFGLSHAQYAAIASMQGLPNVVLAFITGSIVDCIGFRKASLIFTAMVAAGTLLVSLSSVGGMVWMLMVGQIVIGIGKQVISVSQKVALPYIAMQRHMSISLAANLAVNRIGMSMGWALSPMLIDEKSGECSHALALSFGLCLFSFVCSLVLVYLTRPDTPATQPNGSIWKKYKNEDADNATSPHTDTTGKQPTTKLLRYRRGDSEASSSSSSLSVSSAAAAAGGAIEMSGLMKKKIMKMMAKKGGGSRTTPNSDSADSVSAAGSPNRSMVPTGITTTVECANPNDVSGSHQCCSIVIRDRDRQHDKQSSSSSSFPSSSSFTSSSFKTKNSKLQGPGKSKNKYLTHKIVGNASGVRTKVGQFFLGLYQGIVTFPLPFWLLTGAMVMFYSCVLPFKVVALEFLMDDRGLSETAADELIAVISIIPILGCLGTGWLIDTTGLISEALTMGMVAILTAFYVFYHAPGNEIVGIVLLGVADSLVSTAGWTLIPQVVQRNRRGLAIGLVHAIENSWDVPLNSLFGWMRDRTGTHVQTIQSMIVLAFAGICFAVLFKNSWERWQARKS
mmetsp:Transcript_7192/g.13335  ORF Transcript_7192/g.13335 Transcript_7192/m.13335 type:complete len:644 (+) Transcript_7192:167-2098(+)|eukprot:CAMPEP_0197531496 /NCGR_PEP_ID=MMETSP1318-20131121/35926_1 /TAXON_ID=552666 /ORGANISM="Partenskyella glossopodia, Strain RCC365" /LENGTH=643 /DNA_ID=CAMNT_0043087741 /DNA_START=49 /DNA_END=1980 /DNA_ORIENTATION=-